LICPTKKVLAQILNIVSELKNLTMRTNLFMLFMILVVTAFSTTVQASPADIASEKAKIAAMTDDQREALIQHMEGRVNEIYAMDMSKLSAEERKSLRDEVKGIKKESKWVRGGGIYISVGALLVIILLLILLR
jgi:hypothetical protein